MFWMTTPMLSWQKLLKFLQTFVEEDYQVISYLPNVEDSAVPTGGLNHTDYTVVLTATFYQPFDFSGRPSELLYKFQCKAQGLAPSFALHCSKGIRTVYTSLSCSYSNTLKSPSRSLSFGNYSFCPLCELACCLQPFRLIGMH